MRSSIIHLLSMLSSVVVIGESNCLLAFAYWNCKKWKVNRQRGIRQAPVRPRKSLQERKPWCPYRPLPGGGVEGSDLRRGLLEPSEAVFVLPETMMGQMDTTHTLSKARRMGRYIVPMLRVAGGDVLLRNVR